MDLLLKDLCGRLPYGVKCFVNYIICNETTDYEDVKSSTVDTLVAINQQTESYFFERLCEWFDIDEFKPYLFPLSSMTEEQKKEFKEISKCEDEIKDYGGFDSEGVYLIEIGKYEYEYDIDTTIEEFYFNYKIINWLNENHFDYMELIEKGLALDATELRIYE